MPDIRLLAVLGAVLIVSAGAIVGAQQSASDLEAAAKQAEQAGRVQEAFDLYVRAVQALPDPPPLDDDVRLRSQVMTVASRLPSRPATPEDAERFGVRAQVQARDAKDRDGYAKAEAEFRKAVRVAPWVPDFAYNLALVEEKLEHYRAAAANLKLYLLANPKDAADVKAKMYEFELKREDAQVAAAEDCEQDDIPRCGTYLGKLRSKQLTSPEAARARKAYERTRAACNAGRVTGCAPAAALLLPFRGSEIGLGEDDATAHQLMNKGCENNDFDSCNLLNAEARVGSAGVRTGSGGTLNRQQKELARQLEARRHRAIALLQTFCASSAWACNHAGLLHEFGSLDGAIKKDASVARSYYQKAAALAARGCDAGSAVDCSALAWLFGGVAWITDGITFNGLGFDGARAAVLYQRACDLKVDDGGIACQRAAKLRPKTD